MSGGNASIRCFYPCNPWLDLLSQLNECCTSTALIGWGGQESGNVRVAVEQGADGAAKGARAVTVNDSDFAQARQRCFVQEFINCIDCFVSRLSDNVQLRLRFVISRRETSFGLGGA